MLPALAAAPGYADFVDTLVLAVASVAKRDADMIADLPLAEFIDVVRVVVVAMLERNTDYIAGPVTEAIQRVTEVARAISDAQARS